MKRTAILLVLLLAPSVLSAQGVVNVASVYGRVEWKSASSQQFAPLAASTQTVRVGDQIRTGADGTLVIRVPDGSYMVVDENTTVTVQEFWAGATLRDLLNVMMGKVRFYIQRLGGQPNPYRVNTPDALIAVRGTIFDVSVDEARNTEVRCLEGSVTVENSSLPDREVILLEGRQSLVRPGEYPTTPVGNDEELVKDRVVHVSRRGPQDPANGIDPIIDTILHNNALRNQPVDPLQAPGGNIGNGEGAARSRTLRYPQ